MSTLPEGTVTFLFTDIEGSTPLWEKDPALMSEALQLHHQVLSQAIQAHGGVVFRIVGDSICAAFWTAHQALEAAVDGQRGLSSAEWNELGELKVRMGIHSGEAYPNQAGDYIDTHTLNRVARVMSAGHGGQILLSQVSASLCEGRLPAGIELIDRGQHRMKGMQRLEHLYQVAGCALVAHFPPLKTLDAYPNNLPLQLTSFLGREQEIAEIQERMKESRLVTLTGPGGVGKTRLSLEIASQALEDFPSGVWFVELALVSNPEAIPQTVAKTIGVHSEKQLPWMEALFAHLGSKQVLIVLDNCEHIIAACARFAEALLTRSPGVRILATSREVFGIAGEAVYSVPSLNFPDAYQLPAFEAFTAYAAVRLFEERSRAVASDFRVSQENAFAVARICQHLDGIPLAIELASARASTLTPAQIAARLEDVFGLLTAGKRTSLPRHQTLLAAIRWSYDLLSDQEKRLLCRLAIFLGGWSLEAAEAVCSGKGLPREEIYELLCSLANKSMVIVQRGQAQEVRYMLLETIRQYAAEELLEAGETDWTARQHFEYFLAEAQARNAQLGGPLILKAFMWFVREQTNLQAALEWARSGTPPHDLPGAEQMAEITHHDWHGHGTHRLTGPDL